MNLLTDTDVAERFEMSVDEIRRRCRSGEFAHVRIGRKYRFTEDDLTAIVEAHRREANVTAANPWGVRTRRSAS